jgi:hypothetical protein
MHENIPKKNSFFIFQRLENLINEDKTNAVCWMHGKFQKTSFIIFKDANVNFHMSP